MLPKMDEKAFTLVELMITVAISIIVAGAITWVYVSQQRIYNEQEKVAEMQQNIRAALDMLATEIRMVGYDPTGQAGSGITVASAGQFSFSQDLNEDQDTLDAGETVDYGFSLAEDADPQRDGIPDTLTNGVPDAISLRRRTSVAGGYQAIADNIQAIEFFYTLDTGAQTSNPTPAQLNTIRAVQVSILARASERDENFLNTLTYCPASNPLNPATGQCTTFPATATAPVWGPFNDNFRRRLLITTVQCRNMGI